MATDGWLPLHQVYVLTGIGDGERGVNAGDSAAHNQYVGIDLDFALLQAELSRRGGLRRLTSAFDFFVASALSLVTQETCSRMLAIWREGIDTRPRRRPAEGRFVHQRGAGGDDDAVQVVFLDILLDEFLPGSEHMNLISRAMTTFGRLRANSATAATSTLPAILMPQ